MNEKCTKEGGLQRFPPTIKTHVPSTDSYITRRQHTYVCYL